MKKMVTVITLAKPNDTSTIAFNNIKLTILTNLATEKYISALITEHSLAKLHATM